MTPAPTNTQSMKDVLAKAKDIFVMLPKNPSADMVASGLGVFESLNTGDKGVYIACPTPIGEDQFPIQGVDQIASKIGNRNLVISLKVASRESIDKVSYNLDESAKEFNLVIQPKKGHPPLKTNDIDYSYAGVQADVVIVIGANRLEDLDQFYKDEQRLFSEATTINISRNPASKFGVYNFTDPQTGSLSEVAMKFITELGIKMNKKSADDLIIGIDQATNYLQSPMVSANTFEALAELMRAGGQRKQLPANGNANNGSMNPQRTNGQPGHVPQEWLSPKIYSGSATNKN